MAGPPAAHVGPAPPLAFPPPPAAPAESRDKWRRGRRALSLRSRQRAALRPWPATDEDRARGRDSGARGPGNCLPYPPPAAAPSPGGAAPGPRVPASGLGVGSRAPARVCARVCVCIGARAPRSPAAAPNQLGTVNSVSPCPSASRAAGSTSRDSAGLCCLRWWRQEGNKVCREPG